MALMKWGVPNQTDMGRRVSIPYTAFDWLIAFGIIHHTVHPSIDADRQSEILDWIRKNCSGYVYNVQYESKNRKFWIWEFYFKTEADAMYFKMWL
jgi:hypothetical protein